MATATAGLGHRFLPVAEGGVRRHRQEVPLSVPGPSLAKPGGPAHLVIASDPAVGQDRAMTVEHLQGPLGPPPVPHVLGDPGLRAAFLVVGPFPRQGEPEVHQGVFGVGDLTEEDAHLTVLDLAEPAAPLALHAHRGGALLGEGRGVEDEHGVGLPDRDDNLAGPFADERFVVLIDLTEEPLDDLAVAVVTVGEGLGVLALDVGEQSGEIGVGMGATLDAGQRGGERPCELLPSGHHAAEQRGRDRTGSEPLLLATLEAGLHRRPPSIREYPLEGIDTKTLATKQGSPDSRNIPM